MPKHKTDLIPQTLEDERIYSKYSGKKAEYSSPSQSRFESSQLRNSPSDFEKKIREQRKKEIMQRINDLNNKIQPIAKSPTRMPSDYLNMLHSNLSQHAPVDEQKLYKSPQQSRIQQSQLQTQVKSEATYQHS